jgi:hypothetical protein
LTGICSSVESVFLEGLGGETRALGRATTAARAVTFVLAAGFAGAFSTFAGFAAFFAGFAGFEDFAGFFTVIEITKGKDRPENHVKTRPEVPF